MKDYTSKILAECLARLDFLERVAPGMQLLPSEPDKINIMDNAKDKIVRVGIRDGKIYCETCETLECRHVHYVMIYPDLKDLTAKVNEI